ncbi:MAG: SDR family oxidoreductase [Alphaproteobacteria bacterium]
MSSVICNEIYEATLEGLRTSPRRWLVTGAAGFIGSHLVETLLAADQEVTALDNFSTGHRANIETIRAGVTPAQWARLHFIEGDVRELATCREAVRDADHVLHQAALGSVPRSIADPLQSHASNVTGFLNMLVACAEAGVARLVFASSSSVYGDHPELPKREAAIGRPLSPYAVTKLADELYAHAFGLHSGLTTVGLRYFNVFGPRQDPDGPYAAVIPRWLKALLAGTPPTINGDGQTSRDFTFVANVVQANILCALSASIEKGSHVFNVACGAEATLRELLELMIQALSARTELPRVEPVLAPFRPGDVRHSLADISALEAAVGYKVTHDMAVGIEKTVEYFVRQQGGV